MNHRMFKQNEMKEKNTLDFSVKEISFDFIIACCQRLCKTQTNFMQTQKRRYVRDNYIFTIYTQMMKFKLRIKLRFYIVEQRKKKSRVGKYLNKKYFRLIIDNYP